jgi:hypothetical protein
MQNQIIPEQIATPKTEGTRKRGRPRKRERELGRRGHKWNGIKKGRPWPQAVGNGIEEKLYRKQVHREV